MPHYPKTSYATSKGDDLKLLFDTHAWLWFVHGDVMLPKAFFDAIQTPANTIFLSVASAWEVQIKCATGKLQL
jgi:PIN domain nuclease of toxin-antitoxin system